MDYSSINLRYSQLAKTECCLSCGGALNFSKVQPGEICVDLGSGRGHRCASNGRTRRRRGFAYGIDISDGMLAAARRMPVNLRVSNVKFIQSELEKLEVPDQQANLDLYRIVPLTTLRIKQPYGTRNFQDSEKGGGRFVVSDIYATSPVPEEYRNDPVAVSECWAGSVTREEYLDTLNAAGFQTITVLEESKPYPKGKVEVCSFTIAGERPKGKTCGCKA